MILVDAGPIIALMVLSDKYHLRASEAMAHIKDDLFTTEVCLAEIIYMASKGGGHLAVDGVWRMLESGTVTILPSYPNGPLRAKVYMNRFSDQPCDYADATLLVAAEETRCRTVFTVDQHFYAYRLHSGEFLTVIN